MREGKRCVTAHWLNDILAKKKMKHPWYAHHLPVPFSDEKPCKNQIISISNFEADERTVLKHVIQILGAKYTGYMTSHNTVIICKRYIYVFIVKEGKKVQRAKSWRIPVVNVQWLHDLMFGHFEALRLPMAHKYQQYDLDNPFALDYALVPHLMAAWKVPIKISEELLKKHDIKESSANEKTAAVEKNKLAIGSEHNVDFHNYEMLVESPPLEENIPLTTQNPPDNENKPRVLFSGLLNIKEYAKIVCQLGGCLAKSPVESTHLVANQYVRTVKFLCAIHVVKYVVTVDWLKECEKQNQFVDEEPYILQDPENEKTYSFSLKSTLRRIDRTPLFKDFIFFITAGVFPKPDVLKLIIEAGGGIPVFKKAPSLRQVETLKQSGKKFVIITCENDLHLCKMYLEKNISVQNVEFVLTGSVRQDLDFTSFAFTS
ncbi:PAX-interacting protein 1-like [Stegodyphus dumicola]|uniref:PAX-interacting protein 1-like n=1 Tax=Stegodyphus dumicola TaxID=202533 RepID=UPI0015ABABCA|nr:PAX-interacting protein 1-like [Stegodyphus dumicola]